MNRKDIADFRPSRITLSLAPGIGKSAAQLLLDQLGRVQHSDVVSEALGHFLLSVQTEDAGRLPWNSLNFWKHVPELSVEPLCDFPRQLQVLLLILAHWNQVRFVEEDVGGLQHRVVEEPCGGS